MLMSNIYICFSIRIYTIKQIWKYINDFGLRFIIL